MHAQIVTGFGHDVCTNVARGLPRRATRLRAEGVKPVRASADETELDPSQQVLGDSSLQNGARCYLNAQGDLVCTKIEPGEYVVKSVANIKREEMGAVGMAPRCSVDDPASCVTYCHLSGDGELMCEGVPEGTYTVHRAAAADIEGMLEDLREFDGDG